MATTTTTSSLEEEESSTFSINDDETNSISDDDSPYRITASVLKTSTNIMTSIPKSDDYNPFLFTAPTNGRQRRPFNINFLISALLVSTSGLVSTFFYIQIARHHLKAMRQNKRFKVREQLARDECEDNAAAAFRG